jgi:hypothetical protein
MFFNEDYSDEIEEDEMNAKCSMNGKMRSA